MDMRMRFSYIPSLPSSSISLTGDGRRAVWSAAEKVTVGLTGSKGSLLLG